MAENGNHVGSQYLLGELDRMIEKSDSDCDRTTFVVLKGIYLELRGLKNEVAQNPFFVLGKWAQKYPKSAVGFIVFSTVLIFANLWHVGIKPVITALFVLLGIPEELVP